MVWKEKLVSSSSKAKYIFPTSFSPLWCVMQGQVLSLRPDPWLGWCHVHQAGSEMPTSLDAVSAGPGRVRWSVDSSWDRLPTSLWSPHCWPHAAECAIHWLLIASSYHSLPQLKRLWQTSSWPLAAPLQQLKREPQPPKQFICKQKLVAQAKWGVSCLVQYVLVLLLL